MPAVASGVPRCARTYALGLSAAVPETSIVSRRLNASVVFGFTSNAVAVMDAFVITPNVTTPPTPSVPSVSEANVWFAATDRVPFDSSVTALAGGNEPVPVSSQTPLAVMRVGPAHACGTVKRKPVFRPATPAPTVTPCGSSSG